MKKAYLVVFAVVFLTAVITAFWMHIVSKRLGEQGRSVDEVDITEETKMDVVNVAKQGQDKQEPIEKNNLVSKNEVKKSSKSETVVKDDEARSIARGAIGDMEFDVKSEIRVERLGGMIRVVFPVNTQTPTGTRYRGPDYAAEVYIDGHSGKVLQARQGG